MLTRYSFIAGLKPAFLQSDDFFNNPVLFTEEISEMVETFVAHKHDLSELQKKKNYLIQYIEDYKELLEKLEQEKQLYQNNIIEAENERQEIDQQLKILESNPVYESNLVSYFFWTDPNQTSVTAVKLYCQNQILYSQEIHINNAYSRICKIEYRQKKKRDDLIQRLQRGYKMITSSTFEEIKNFAIKDINP